MSLKLHCTKKYTEVLKNQWTSMFNMANWILQSTPLTWTVFRFPSEFELPGLFKLRSNEGISFQTIARHWFWKITCTTSGLSSRTYASMVLSRDDGYEQRWNSSSSTRFCNEEKAVRGCLFWAWTFPATTSSWSTVAFALFSPKPSKVHITNAREIYYFSFLSYSIPPFLWAFQS